MTSLVFKICTLHSDVCADIAWGNYMYVCTERERERETILHDCKSYIIWPNTHKKLTMFYLSTKYNVYHSPLALYIDIYLYI
jgi:hypothetical protein